MRTAIRSYDTAGSSASPKGERRFRGASGMSGPRRGPRRSQLYPWRLHRHALLSLTAKEFAAVSEKLDEGCSTLSARCPPFSDLPTSSQPDK